MAEYRTIGFIGLGVMGEPICRNPREEERQARVSRSISRPSRWRALRADGAEVAASVADVDQARAISLFLCLPSAKHVRAVFEGDGILNNIRERPGRRRSRYVVGQPDPRFRAAVAGQGRAWADAPIARTRQAAQDGTLSVMVGASPGFIAAIEPLIRCFATDVTHCGEVGAGQVTKSSTTWCCSRPSMRSPKRSRWPSTMASIRSCLLDTLSKGSADSFCAAQSRHEGDRAGRISGTRVLDRICAEGPVLRAGARRDAGLRDSRRGADRHDSAGSDRCRIGRELFSCDREAY